MSDSLHPLFTIAATDALKQRAVRGALAAGGSQAIKVVVQFISVALLARFLTPHDFGLIAMITPVIGFSILFQDFGLTQALVTAPHLTQAEATGIFRLNVALSTALAILIALLSPLIAAFYHEPAVIGLTIGLALQMILSGATSSHLALLTRGMRFNQLAVIETVRAIVSLVAAVAIAYVWASPWALVLQAGAGALIVLIMAWTMTGWIPSGPAPWRELQSMLRFGVGMTTLNVSNYLSRNADNVMIGWARGPIELGLYDRAYKLLLFPLQQINAPIGGVMIPVLSRLVSEPDRYRAAYRRTLQMMLLLTVPGTVCLILTAPVLIPTLLGARWAPAAPIFQWLGFAGIHQTISTTFGWLFVSQRRTGEYARFGIFSTATTIAAFAAGLPWGAVGVAAAYGVTGLTIRLPALIWIVGRSGPVSRRDIVRLALPYAASAVAAAAVWNPIRALFPSDPLAFLVLSGLIIFLTFAATVAMTRGGREGIAEFINLLPRRQRSLG